MLLDRHMVYQENHFKHNTSRSKISNGNCFEITTKKKKKYRKFILREYTQYKLVRVSGCIAQGTISNHLWNTKENNMKKRIYKYITGSLCYTAEIDRTL